MSTVFKGNLAALSLSLSREKKDDMVSDYSRDDCDFKLESKCSSAVPELRCSRPLSTFRTCTKMIVIAIIIIFVVNNNLNIYQNIINRDSAQMASDLFTETDIKTTLSSHSTPMFERKRNKSTMPKNLDPALPFQPFIYNYSLKELELKKTYFFLYSHPLPPKFKIHDPVIHDQECDSLRLSSTQLCLGGGQTVDLKTFTLPQANYGSRCGPYELTDSTFCINRNVVIDLSILNHIQRETFYDRLLHFVLEPEPFRKIFEPPSPEVKLEIVLMEMIPIKSTRLIKTIYNIANVYGGTGASLTILICPIHYKSIEFLEEEEGFGWKGINIIQLGREYGPEEFQEMLTSLWLSEYYEGKQILMVHPDTMLLRPIEPSMLSDKFDIIGTPYSFDVDVLEDPPPAPEPEKIAINDGKGDGNSNENEMAESKGLNDTISANKTSESELELDGNGNANAVNETFPISPPPFIPRIFHKVMTVGNTATGYSLRRLDKIKQLVSETPNGQKEIPEDMYWASKMMNASLEITARFSISSDAQVDLFANKNYTHIPTGVYALWKFPKLFGKVGGRILRKFVNDNIYQDGPDPALIFAPNNKTSA